VKNHFALFVGLGVGIKVLDATGVEGARSPDDSVHFVALLE